MDANGWRPKEGDKVLVEGTLSDQFIEGNDSEWWVIMPDGTTVLFNRKQIHLPPPPAQEGK